MENLCYFRRKVYWCFWMAAPSKASLKSVSGLLTTEDALIIQVAISSDSASPKTIPFMVTLRRFRVTPAWIWCSCLMSLRLFMSKSTLHLSHSPTSNSVLAKYTVYLLHLIWYSMFIPPAFTLLSNNSWIYLNWKATVALQTQFSTLNYLMQPEWIKTTTLHRCDRWVYH